MLAMLLLSACATTQQQEPDIKRISPEELARIMPKAVPNLTLDEIVTLSKQGVPADQVIDKIKASKSLYDLKPSDVLRLSKQGVDPKVLDYIQQAHEAALRENLADEINKREKQHRLEQEKLQREYQLRSYPYYDPWWGWAPGPYWPYYGPSFRYYRGW